MVVVWDSDQCESFRYFNPELICRNKTNRSAVAEKPRDLHSLELLYTERHKILPNCYFTNVHVVCLCFLLSYFVYWLWTHIREFHDDVWFEKTKTMRVENGEKRYVAAGIWRVKMIDRLTL